MLTSFILALRAAVVAMLVMLGISSLTSLALALRVVLVAIKYFIFNIFYLSIIYIFLTTPFFTTSLRLLKPTGTEAFINI